MKHLSLLALPFLLSGCTTPSANSDPSTISTPVPMNVSSGKEFDYKAVSARAKEASSVVTAQNDFGTRLLVRLEEKNAKHENLIASPTSLWQALAMATGGAKGETKTQMKTLLALPNQTEEQIGAANRAFNTLLAEQKGASISVANSVWFADTFQPNPAFTTMASKNFAASVGKFASADAAGGAEKINAWVSEHTQKEIPQIVEAGDVEGNSAMLVNAVYFRGGWENTFDKSQTKPAPFHLADGTTVQVPMMHREYGHGYLNGESFEGISLPYENTSCALWVLLPKGKQTPADVLREVGELDKKSGADLYGREEVVLSLPRFEVQWRDTVTKDLAAMDAPVPFGKGADFSGMGTPIANISSVIHVCKMRVDEEGTVAAAATAIGMAGAAAPVQREKKILTFDRPFVVALMEENSKARLFEGMVYDPRS